MKITNHLDHISNFSLALVRSSQFPICDAPGPHKRIESWGSPGAITARIGGYIRRTTGSNASFDFKSFPFSNIPSSRRKSNSRWT